MDKNSPEVQSQCQRIGSHFSQNLPEDHHLRESGNKGNTYLADMSKAYLL